MPKSWWFLFLTWLGLLIFSASSWGKTLVYSVSVGGHKVGSVLVDLQDNGKVFYRYIPVPIASLMRPSVLYLGNRLSLKRTIVLSGAGGSQLPFPLLTCNARGLTGYREPSEQPPFDLEITYFHIGSLIHLFTMNVAVEFTIDGNGVISGQKLTVSSGWEDNGKNLLNGSVLLPYALADTGSLIPGGASNSPVQYAFLEAGIAEGVVLSHSSDESNDDGNTPHSITMNVHDTSIDFYLQLNSDGIIQTLTMTMPDEKNTVTVSLDKIIPDPEPPSAD